MGSSSYWFWRFWRFLYKSCQFSLNYTTHRGCSAATGDTGVLNQWNSKTSNDFRLNVWLKTMLIFVDFWPAWFFVGFDSFLYGWLLAMACWQVIAIGYILSPKSPKSEQEFHAFLEIRVTKNTKKSILGFVFLGDFFTDSTMGKSPWKNPTIWGIMFFNFSQAPNIKQI